MSKVEELLERLLRVDKTPLFCAQGECGFTEGKHIPTRAELEELVAEGVVEERERIVGKSQLGTYPFVDDGILHAFNVWVVPRRVLDPEGITEPPASAFVPETATTTLLEDCGTSGVVTRGGLFPPVLAPTKEQP